MATGRRTKSTLKVRPKHRQDRALKNRRVKAKQAASRKRGKNRMKARRRAGIRRGIR